MDKIPSFLKNKFVYTGILFAMYAMFLDDMDVFSIVRYQNKLEQLAESKVNLERQLEETKETLEELKNLSGKERYARERKYFKKDDEDIFVYFLRVIRM